ncbi:MAG: YegS/Rv2252/BmrU family lipid kinase [Bacteroidetes bacterium]|nr:YegS/Rv2252/BmrU family lipid kinase [Bacteroidota bacterium]
MQSVALVCNITAGKGRASSVLNILQQKFNDLELSHTIFTEIWPKNFDGFSSIWLIGGDGTLNYFINKYPGLTIPIALFKGGSGNDFAWKLYGNISVDDFLDRVLESKTRKVDIGICNGKYFVNGVGIGFDGEVVKAMGQKKILPGHMGYMLTVLKKIFLYKEKKMRVIVDGSESNQEIFMINIANGSRYGGGFMVAPQAVIDDGELDIVIVDKIPPVKRLFYLPKVEVGKHLDLPLVEVLKKNKIRVQSEFILTAHLDGELMETNKFEIEIIPGALKFIC